MKQPSCFVYRILCRFFYFFRICEMFSVCYICWGDGKNPYLPVICNTTYVPYNKVSKTLHFWHSQISIQIPVNPLNANLTKWSNTLR